MDPETTRWVIAGSFAFALLLFGFCWHEAKRIARNLHDLRNWCDKWSKGFENRFRRLERQVDRNEGDDK